jgi:tetratricopeptide (TPR) repeat protein
LDHWLQAALLHRARGEHAELAAALAGAAAAAHAHADASARLGDWLSRQELFEPAYAAYERAITLRPDHAAYWFNRAAVSRFLGRLEQAEADYDQCIAHDPCDAQAWLNRSELRSQTPARNHIAPLETLLAGQRWPWEREVPLRYALAKEYEDLGNYEAAWAHLASGAALRRRHLQYDPSVDLQTVQWLIDAFPGRVGAGAAGNPSTAPIFILGMPRTGSTLVDRMISSHSQVTAAGELPDFGLAVVDAARHRLGPATAKTVTRAALVAASAHVDFAALGADYLARTRPRAGVTAHFTDKLPLNYLYCGLIDAALPAGQMVHVRRHPMATCFGIFKVLFDQGYPFSYDLTEIADYYIAYRRLVQHWQSILPGRIIEVGYESLVTDTAGACRGLIGALGLPWEDSCLQFHRNPAPATTASASQVRRPIYTSALHLWRQYAKPLAPLRARLEAAGVRCEEN